MNSACKIVEIFIVQESIYQNRFLTYQNHVLTNQNIFDVGFIFISKYSFDVQSEPVFAHADLGHCWS
jgi:hypothetical protein